MDRRTLTGMLICVVFYIAYTMYLQKRYPDYGKPPVQTEETAQTTVSETTSGSDTTAALTPSKSESATPAVPEQRVTQLSTQDLTVETPELRVVFDQDKAAITSLQLPAYKDDAQKPEDRKPIELAHRPIIIQPLLDPTQTTPAQGFSAERVDAKTIRFMNTQNQVKRTVTYKFQDGHYTVEVDVLIRNDSSDNKELTSGVFVNTTRIVQGSGGFTLIPDANSRYERIISGVGGSRNGETMDDFCKKDSTTPALSGENETIDFAGFDFHYFLAVLSPEGKGFWHQVNKTKPATVGTSCHLTLNIWQPQGQLKPAEESSVKFKVFFGPKDVDILAKENPSLKETMDLGWFSAIGRPLLVVIKAINDNLTFNYGLAIIFLTICLKILFYPLTKSAAVSMKRMQLYTPEINRIKEKYKDDKQQQQKEMMQFLGKHKINPAKGCLPILPQIPVFIAFYNVLSQSIDLRHAPFFGWIQDLSAKDPYLVTPILLGALMLVQQKLTPNPTMDKTQARIMMMMPLMFTFMMLSLPAGMVLYMITNTVVSIMQQQWLNRHLNVQTADV